MFMTGYDPQLLASFLAVEQTGSFTRAASRLGIQQPTVSQHIRRLEQQVGRILVLRDTHSVSLTADGEAMAGFARNIVAASDQAAAFFSGARPRGRLRIGISDDLALTRLPQILRDFRRENPLVDFDLTVDQSGLLHQRLEGDKLDVFIGKRPSGEERGRLVKRDRLVWVGTPSTRLDMTRPLPLVVYPAPSVTRTEIRRALNRAQLPFRSACVCRGVNGLIAAVAAGIGVSALAASMVPAQLTTLGPGHKLPELGTIDLVLLTNPRADRRPAVRALISTVLASGSRSLVAYRDETTEGPTAHPRSLAARRTEDTRGSGSCADWKGCRRKWCG
jgi:DNA-binding transcriptional LysR family regulator